MFDEATTPPEGATAPDAAAAELETATTTTPADAEAAADAGTPAGFSAGDGIGTVELTAPFVDVPQLGRIVHFVNGFAEERAAIVTAVHPDGRAQLCSFRPTGVPEPITEPVDYDPEGGPFTWHWYADCPRNR